METLLQHEVIDKKEVKKSINSMVIPIVIESILQMTAGFFLMGMIGRLEPVSISSFGISNRIINIVWAMLKGITVGTSVHVAQAYGSKDNKNIKHVVTQTIISLLVVIFIVQQLIFWNAGSILKIFNPEPQLMEIGTRCLKTASWSLYFLGIMITVTSTLQAMSNSKTPMKITMIMNCVSIFVGYLFIFGNFGLPNLGVQGAPLGMICGYFVSASIGVYILFNKKKGSVYFEEENKEKISILKNIKPDMKQIINIFKIGLPSSFENSFWQIATIILTRAVLTYGETSLAAYQLGLQAESISYMPSMGFAIASTAFVGQTVGARNEKLGKIYIKELLRGTILITIATSIPLILFPHQLMLLLTNDPELINIAAIYLLVMGFVQLPGNLSGVINGALRGAGHTKVPMGVSAAGIWGIRIPLTIVIVYYTNLNIAWVWIAMGVDLCFRFFSSYIIYSKKDLYNNNIISKTIS